MISGACSRFLEISARFAPDALKMRSVGCRVVEHSIANLSPAERDSIPAADRQVFAGFDANHEDHYGVARMMIEKLGLWDEFSSRPLNSHHATIDKYRDQLDVFQDLPRSPGGSLTLDQINAVIGVHAHA